MPADDDDPDALRRLVFGRPPQFADDRSEDAHRASVSEAGARLRELGKSRPTVTTAPDDRPIATAASSSPGPISPLAASVDVRSPIDQLGPDDPSPQHAPRRRRRRWPLVVASVAILGLVGGFAVVQSLPTPLPDPLPQNVVTKPSALEYLGVTELVALANWHGWTVYIGPSDRIHGDNCLVLWREGAGGSNCASGEISSPYDFAGEFDDYYVPVDPASETFTADFSYVPGDGLTIENPHGKETIHVIYRDDPQDLVTDAESASIAAHAPEWIVTTVDPRSVVSPAAASEPRAVFGMHDASRIVTWHGSTVVVGRAADGQRDCIVVVRSGTTAVDCGDGEASLSAVLDPRTYGAPLPLEPRQLATFSYRPSEQVTVAFGAERFVASVDTN